MKERIIGERPQRMEKPTKTKQKPDKLFNLIIIKMMAALAFSVALLVGGVTLLVYSLNPYAAVIIGFEEEIISVWSFLGIHLTLLLFYYAVALFKYIVSD